MFYTESAMRAYDQMQQASLTNHGRQIKLCLESRQMKDLYPSILDSVHPMLPSSCSRVDSCPGVTHATQTSGGNPRLRCSNCSTARLQLYWVSQKRCFQQVRGTVVGPSVPVEPQVSCEYCMEPHLEDGELDVEDGEVAAGGTAQV